MTLHVLRSGTDQYECVLYRRRYFWQRVGTGIRVGWIGRFVARDYPVGSVLVLSGSVMERRPMESAP